MTLKIAICLTLLAGIFFSCFMGAKALQYNLTMGLFFIAQSIALAAVFSIAIRNTIFNKKSS